MGSDAQGVLLSVCALALYVALYTKLILIAISAAKGGANVRGGTAISLFPLEGHQRCRPGQRHAVSTRKPVNQDGEVYRNTKGLDSFTKNNTQTDPTMTGLIESQQLDTLPIFSPRLMQK